MAYAVAAPDTGAGHMIATRIAERRPVAPNCKRVDETGQDRRPIKASQLRRRIGAAHPAQRPAPPARARVVKDEPVADARSEQRQKLLTPEPRVVSSLEQATSRENARAQSIAHAEAGERVLEPGLLSDHG